MKAFDKSNLTVRPDGTKTKIIAIRVTKDIHDQLHTEARIEHRSASAQAIHILEQYFNSNAAE